MALILKGCPKEEVKIGDYSFTVRGLTRQETFELFGNAKEVEDDVISQAKFTDKIIEYAVEDEKAKELINQLPINEYQQVVQLILDLSGLGEKSKN